MWNVVAITGGCGFIGSGLLREGVVRHHNTLWINIDRADRSDPEVARRIASLHYANNFVDIELDLCNQSELMRQVFQAYNVDCVVHCAAESNVDRSFTNMSGCVMDNVFATTVLLECMITAAYTPKRWIMVSTDEVLGECEAYQSEVSPTNPTNPYAMTKVFCEQIAAMCNKNFSIKALITRSNNIYGPYQDDSKVIPAFCKALLLGESLHLNGDGSARRCFIYLDDIVQAFMMFIEHDTAGGIYHLATSHGDEISMVHLASELAKIHIDDVTRTSSDAKTAQPSVKYVKDRIYNDKCYHIMDTKLKGRWAPSTPFLIGLRKTYLWYKSCMAPRCTSKSSGTAMP